MQIIVYTKPGCDLCAGFKEKLTNHLKVPFAERSLEDALVQCETWREDGTVEVVTAHAAIDENVPLILVDGEPFDYAGALAAIKKRLAAGETCEKPGKAPGDGKDLKTAFKEMTEEQFVVAMFKVCGNCIDLLFVSSRAKRRYDGKSTTLWGLEVEGPINVEVKVRDPYRKPMKHTGFQVMADDFKTLLVRAELRVREMKAQDVL